MRILAYLFAWIMIGLEKFSALVWEETLKIKDRL